MTTISDDQLLNRVKSANNITGDYQDDTIQIYIDEVKENLIDSGVPAAVVNSNKAVGVISRGVYDLWNDGAGNGDLSSYFYKRVKQLKHNPKEDTGTEAS